MPLCSDCHLDAPDSQHRVGDERKFWARVGKDPDEIASRLWGQFERRQKRSPEQREKVVRRARRRKKLVPKIGTNSRKRRGLSQPIRGKFPTQIRQWPKRSFPKRQR